MTPRPGAEGAELTSHQPGALGAVFVVWMIAGPMILVLRWFIGVMHFGIVSGPEPTFEIYARYVAWSIIPSVIILAVSLRSLLRANGMIREPRGRVDPLPLWIAAIVAQVPLYVAEWIVTFTQWRDGGADTYVVLVAIIVAVLVTFIAARWSMRSCKMPPCEGA